MRPSPSSRPAPSATASLTNRASSGSVPPQLVKVKVAGEALVRPLSEAVESLSVTDEDEYQAADELLAGIRHARKAWDEKMEPVLKPLREAKTAADALKRDIDKPMAELEAKVKDHMRRYKVAEAEEISRQARVTAALGAKVQAQLEEAAAKELAAKTPAMKHRLAQSRERLEQRLEEVHEATPEPVRAAHSAVRKVPKWKLADMENGLESILRAVLAGKIPYNVLTLDFSYINKVHLTSRETMKGWPGFELYEETVIAGR